MKGYKIETRPLLSTLWIFILLNMIFRDLHQFASEGFIEDIMALKISEELLLVYGVILEIPILMVVLSRILSGKANTWVNSIAALVVALGILSTIPSADLDDIFFMVMQFVALIAIVIMAWKLSALKKHTALS